MLPFALGHLMERVKNGQHVIILFLALRGLIIMDNNMLRDQLLLRAPAALSRVFFELRHGLFVGERLGLAAPFLGRAQTRLHSVGQGRHGPFWKCTLRGARDCVQTICRDNIPHPHGDGY